jgi:hypothetical protein
MINNLILLVVLLLFILTFFMNNKNEGFYDPSKEDQRPFNMDDHSYDGDLFQSEKLLYDMINNLPESEKKQHLSELLNLLQFI